MKLLRSPNKQYSDMVLCSYETCSQKSKQYDEMVHILLKLCPRSPLQYSDIIPLQSPQVQPAQRYGSCSSETVSHLVQCLMAASVDLGWQDAWSQGRWCCHAPIRAVWSQGNGHPSGCMATGGFPLQRVQILYGKVPHRSSPLSSQEQPPFSNPKISGLCWYPMTSLHVHTLCYCQCLGDWDLARQQSIRGEKSWGHHWQQWWWGFWEGCDWPNQLVKTW